MVKVTIHGSPFATMVHGLRRSSDVKCERLGASDQPDIDATTSLVIWRSHDRNLLNEAPFPSAFYD